MEVLSHRGFWKNKSEKNTILAFERSFSLGFGTETDVRDYRGNLVISHDIAGKDSILFETFLEIYCKFDKTLPLALNIKADGLQLKLKYLLEKYQVNNYFVFDMSVPDGLEYLSLGIKAFTRESEYEEVPSFYSKACGIWLDEFNSHWINKETIKSHIDSNKKICIVSPDLHKRVYSEEWQHYKKIEMELGTDKVMICTDYPEEARKYFYE